MDSSCSDVNGDGSGCSTKSKSHSDVDTLQGSGVSPVASLASVANCFASTRWTRVQPAPDLEHWRIRVGSIVVAMSLDSPASTEEPNTPQQPGHTVGRGETLAVGLIVTLVPLWFVAPVFNLRFIDRALYWGDVRLNVWALAWNHQVLTGRAWPYFDGNIFHPQPGTLAYSEHLFGIALPMLPFHLLGASPALVYNLAWLLSFPLLGIAIHLLCRRSGLGRSGSAAAGVLAASRRSGVAP